MSAHDIVNRLEFYREVREGEWMARCPAHDDRGPSLSIKDVGDGRTLIHCFAGCGAVDVLDAIGMDMTDLYPPSDREYRPVHQQRERSLDELVVEIAMADLREGKTLNEDDKQRCREALERLDDALPGPDIDRNQMTKNVDAVGRRYAERAAILAGEKV